MAREWLSSPLEAWRAAADLTRRLTTAELQRQRDSWAAVLPEAQNWMTRELIENLILSLDIELAARRAQRLN